MLVDILTCVLPRAFVVRRAPELGHNVCIMGREVTRVKLKRKLSSWRETVLKDCGIPQGAVVDCEQHM